MVYIRTFVLSPAKAMLAQMERRLGGRELQDALFKAGNAIGAAALAAVSEYPPPARKPLPEIYTRIVQAGHAYRAPDGSVRIPGATYQSKFKTRRQQGFVMAQIRRIKGSKKKGRKGKRKGSAPNSNVKFTFPYRRTGTLGRSLTYSVDVLGGAKAVIVRVGSNVEYAKYVIRRDTQAPYHQGVWTPLEDDLEREKVSIARAGAVALRSALLQSLRTQRR
ncbi:MAG: hypothetical protein KatS3mg038_1019 [Candidatus Kapaibacterium sp.]|nr:MAG: hypothetical protein KatS3mg038_1019 [Candidatus Kapabacteria bacterium]